MVVDDADLKFSGKRGNFFQVDRSSFDEVRSLGSANAIVVYLLMCSGSGSSNNTSLWSKQSITRYTSLGWTLAELTIDMLCQSGLVHRTMANNQNKYHFGIIGTRTPLSPRQWYVYWAVHDDSLADYSTKHPDTFDILSELIHLKYVTQSPGAYTIVNSGNGPANWIFIPKGICGEKQIVRDHTNTKNVAIYTRGFLDALRGFRNVRALSLLIEIYKREDLREYCGISSNFALISGLNMYGINHERSNSMNYTSEMFYMNYRVVKDIVSGEYSNDAEPFYHLHNYYYSGNNGDYQALRDDRPLERSSVGDSPSDDFLLLERCGLINWVYWMVEKEPATAKTADLGTGRSADRPPVIPILPLLLIGSKGVIRDAIESIVGRYARVAHAAVTAQAQARAGTHEERYGQITLNMSQLTRDAQTLDDEPDDWTKDLKFVQFARPSNRPNIDVVGIARLTCPAHTSRTIDAGTAIDDMARAAIPVFRRLIRRTHPRLLDFEHEAPVAKLLDRLGLTKAPMSQAKAEDIVF